MRYFWNKLFNRKRVEVKPVLTRNFQQAKKVTKEELQAPKEPEEITPEIPKSVKGIIISRDLRHLHPKLRKKFLQAKSQYESDYPGREIIPTCTYRSVKRQQELYQKGRFGNPPPIITRCDGIEKKSKHNLVPSLAVDFAVLEGGKAMWIETYYTPMISISKRLEFVSGATFSFKDLCHLELSEET